MTNVFTELDEVKKHLQGLYLKFENADRIDGKVKDALSPSENAEASKTAALFFEYKGVTYGLASDTTFSAVRRFYNKLEKAINDNAVFIEEETKKGTRCLWLGRTKDEPDGWYCYEAPYFNNWSDSALNKAA